MLAVNYHDVITSEHDEIIVLISYFLSGLPRCNKSVDISSSDIELSLV